MISKGIEYIGDVRIRIAEKRHVSGKARFVVTRKGSFQADVIIVRWHLIGRHVGKDAEASFWLIVQIGWGGRILTPKPKAQK